MLEYYAVRAVKTVRIVVRIGGSVVASPVNPALIGKYAKVLSDLKRKGHEVAVVVGGGTLAREFIRTAKALGLAEKSQDEVAISVSRLFAQLLLAKLGNSGCETVPLTIEKTLNHVKQGKIVVMGGLKPGMTTDTVAAMIADSINADLYVKGTNQDGVYDKDPRKYADAVKLERLTFKELSEILTEDRHKAGLHQILDPEAVRLLKKGKAKVVVVNGAEPNNILWAIKGKGVGTVIS